MTTEIGCHLVPGNIHRIVTLRTEITNKLNLSHAQKSKNTTQLVPKNRKTLNDKTINNLKNVAKLVKTKSRYAYTGTKLLKQ